MPRIVFRGKTYYSVFEMPPNVRRAYEKEQQKARSSAGSAKAAASLTDVVDMPDQIKEMYERAVDREQEETASPQPVVEPVPPTIEPEAVGMRGLIWGVIVALVLTGIAFLLSRLIPW